MDLVDWIERIPEQYRIDQRELGKVLLVASAAIFVVSVHATFTFNAALQEVEQTNNQLDEMELVMNSQSFNNSMQGIQDLTDTAEQRNIYGQFSTAVEAFQTAEEGLDSIDRVEQGLESSYENYQWLALISLLGIVAGGAIIYL